MVQESKQGIKFSALYIYILILFSFFLSNFYRISTVVVLPGLTAEWGISPTTIGIISGVFFYTYALAQPFCGLLSENIGPSKVVLIGISITAFGTFLMGISQSAMLFTIGRFLTGLGLAPMLSAALVYQSYNFPAVRYATFTGITYAAGNMGTIVSVGPLDYLINKFSFPTVYIGLTLICILIGSQLLINILKHRRFQAGSHIHQKQSLLEQLKFSIIYIFESRQLRAMLLIWMVTCGSLLCFQGLWAVQWYNISFDISFTDASKWVSLIGVGIVLGNFFGGRINIFKSRKKTVKIFSVAFALFWIAEWLLLKYTWSLSVAGIVALMMGICAGVEYTQLTTCVNDIAEKGYSGIIFGIMNSFVFLSVVFFQFISGYMVDIFSKYFLDMQESFLCTFAVIILIILINQFSLLFLDDFKKLRVDRGITVE